MDWNSFTFEYELNLTEVLLDIISIEAYKEAALNLVLPPDWKEQLDKLNRVRAVHGTTALEGNPLSEAEVSHQMENLENPSPNNATKEQLQIRNSGLAQGWVKQRFHPGSAPLRLADVLEMHRMVTIDSDTRDNTPGKFRNFQVTVGTPEMGGVHRGAPHEVVPKLMEDYITFVNSRRVSEQYHPVIKALLAHFYLVTIHPFGDGNGRVSRLVEAGILFQGGYNVYGFYGLSNYFYSNETQYKLMLQKCREHQPFDVTPFVIFGLKGFALELKGINNFIKTKLNRIVYRTMLVRAYHKRTGSRRRLLNQREYDLLSFLLTETEPIDPFSDKPSRQIKFADLTNAPFIQSSYKGVTRRTFTRELIRLGQMRFISFREDVQARDWIVELDFGAIEFY